MLSVILFLQVRFGWVRATMTASPGASLADIVKTVIDLHGNRCAWTEPSIGMKRSKGTIDLSKLNKALGMLIRSIDQVSEGAGRLAAWIFVVLGFCVAYEVVMRYVFTAPTIWVDEIARIGQVWAAYLAAAFTLKHREMVVIDVAFRTPGSLSRKLAETFSLLVIGLFCWVTVYYGYQLWFRAMMRGHTTDTYLALPRWFTDASVWIGFGLLAFQVIAELIRLWFPQSHQSASLDKVA